MSSRGGLYDAVSLGVQIYQGKKQAELGNVLGQQLSLSMQQVNQVDKVAQGRRYLIQVEQDIRHAREIIEEYPYYSFAYLLGHIDAMEHSGMAGDYFLETEDMRHAIEIKTKLDQEISEYREKFPEGDNIVAQIMAARTSLDDESIITEVQEGVDAYEFVQSNTEKQEEISQAKKKAEVSSAIAEGRRKIFFLPFIFLLIATISILTKFTDILDSRGPFYFCLLLFLFTFITAKSSIPNELKALERKFKSKNQLYEDTLKRFGAANIDELRSLPKSWSDLLSKYLPTDAKFIFKQ